MAAVKRFAQRDPLQPYANFPTCTSNIKFGSYSCGAIVSICAFYPLKSTHTTFKRQQTVDCRKSIVLNFWPVHLYYFKARQQLEEQPHFNAVQKRPHAPVSKTNSAIIWVGSSPSHQKGCSTAHDSLSNEIKYLPNSPSCLSPVM